MAGNASRSEQDIYRRVLHVEGCVAHSRPYPTAIIMLQKLFTAKLGVEASISVEIQAKSREGFDEGLQRSVKENCNVLRFNSSEFDSE